MTIRSSNDAGRKAPKLAKLELNRETIRELTEEEAEDVAGGGVFRPRTSKSACAGWTKCQCVYTRDYFCPSVQVACTTKCASSI